MPHAHICVIHVAVGLSCAIPQNTGSKSKEKLENELIHILETSYFK